MTENSKNHEAIGSTATSGSETDAVRARPPLSFGTLASAGILAAVLVWTCWTPMETLVHRWWNDSDYTYGFLVPIVAGVILWVRRGMLASYVPRGSLWGLPILAFAGILRWVSVYYYFALVEPLSLVPLLAGIVLFVGGWRALRWAAPAIVLLIFMVPLPGVFAGMMSHPLQRAGTIMATYTLQTLGLPATAQGNVICLTETQLGIVEACSGLRMMMLFFAICFAAAFLVNRPVLDRVVIVLSAAPIALLANVARIVLTGVLQEAGRATAADTLFHDLAGWFMMPLAVVLLWGELAILDRLFVVPQEARGPVAVPKSASAAARMNRHKSRKGAKERA